MLSWLKGGKRPTSSAYAPGGMASLMASSWKSGTISSGRQATVAEVILRRWATSGNAQLVKSFIEIAFGKVPNPIELSNKKGNVLQIEYINDWRNSAEDNTTESS